mmetsp:Transcript_22615/g.31909  ORF Transcript_22615/g.31909 Transcript_22615/m.31909 type:complete len:183 (-) Transcript_22615:827-1375(-)
MHQYLLPLLQFFHYHYQQILHFYQQKYTTILPSILNGNATPSNPTKCSTAKFRHTYFYTTNSTIISISNHIQPYAPSAPPDTTKEMILSFKAIDELLGENLYFQAWKSNVASHLNSNSVWKQMVVSVSPPLFIHSPVPPSLEAADSALFAALKPRMDANAKTLIPVGISSGVELMERLTKAC